MRKRIWSAILALSMLLTLAPAASAANSLTIDLTNGSITVSESNGIMTVVQGDSTSTCTGLFVTGGTIDEPTANTISVTGGNVALTIKDVYIQATDNTSPISVSDGSLALTLGGISRNVLDASTSKGNASKAGISLASGTSLTIDDGGYAYLIVNGGEWAAAIGGDMGRSGGNITINGGTIEANGGTYGAGIGGGYSGVTPSEDEVGGSGGTITINGGTVTATGTAGAGIGGGRYGNGGTVTINGGTVSATSATGAGIGGGQNGYGGYVKIGADVKSVTAEGYCTAIGGGKSGNEYGCTDLIIEDFSKVETAVTLEVSTPFEERFYNNILHNGMTETNTGYGWEYGELRFLARSGKSGYISDETCTWLWQWSADGETDWTEVEYSDYFSIDKKPDGNKYYRCIITNEFGNSIISPVGQILPLEITSQPQDAVAEQGETATFSVETNCNEAVVNWYWQQRFNGGEWTMIAGATTNTLTVTADEDGWEYRCMMEDDDGDCKYTETAALTLCLTPTEILLETPASGNDHPEVTDNSYTFYESGTAVPKNKEWQEIVFYAAGETTVSLDSLPSGVTITALFWDDEDPVPIACEVSDNSITIACDEMPDEAAGRADGYSSELYVTTSDGEVSLLSIRFISTASEDTAPANTLCWRGIEKCGGNVFEPTGEYSTEPITVHGTNTRRVVFYYGDVMLEPDELTFSEHSGLTVEEIEGENEDGEAFTHFRILSENGVGFTKQTVSYKGQSITIKFEAINEPTGGLCYTLVTAVEDENGDQYYVDGEYRTTEISIPSRDQVDIRIYYDGELIESAKDLDYSNNLRFKAIESDDDIFGCFRVSFRDITIDTVQTFAHADDPDDIINVRPNIPPYGFYTKAEPILANLTEELTIEAGGTGTVYFYDVTNESECSSSLWFDNAPKGVSFGEVKRLANNMISVSVSVADTVAVGEFALMATGYDTAELTITVVTETVLDLRDGSIVLYAEDEDEVEAVQTLTDGTKKYYYASAFIVTSGGEATSNTITVADGTAPLTLHDCQIVNGTAPLIDVDEDAELWLTVSENSVLNVQSSDFAAVHVPDGAEFHYLGGSLEILTGGKGAGIGGSVGEGCGTIYIEGGSLNIRSIGQASGIGCGANGSGGLVNIDAAEICIENLGSAGAFGIGGGLNDNAYALDRVILGDDADIKAYDADGNQLELDSGLICQERIYVDPLADTVKNYGYHAKGTSKSGELSYQWQKLTSGAWVDVEGETAPDLTVESWDSGTYRCALTNIYGNTVYTNDATRLSTTGAVVLDLADGPIIVRSNGGFDRYDTGFVVYATQNGQQYGNGGGPYGGKLIVVQSTKTTTNTITSYDGRVPMTAINLCIETETGPAISVTGGKLDLTLSGKNEFEVEEGPAIHVTRGSQSYPLDITGDGNAELYVSTGSKTAAAIGSGENEYAGGVSLYNVKGSIRGGLHAIGSGSESAEYGCYYLSISNCPDLSLKAGKRDVVLQERITAGALEKTVLWSGAIKASVTYPTSNVTYQWERSSDGVTWETIKGAAAAEHIVEPIYSGWYHRCIVTNTYGNELVVGPGQMYCLMITEQPAPAVATSGAQAAFTAKTNADAKNWLWQVSTDGGTSWSTVGTQQTGGAESTLTLTAEEAMNGNLYRCRIADSSSAYAYTEPAALTIAKPMPYTLDSIVLRDQSTNAVLDAIPSGSFFAELTFTNVSADAAATFLLITYDADGMMLDMDYCIAFPDVGRSMTWGALIRNDGSAARIQAMALSSLGELIPVAESLEYPAAQ